MVETPLYEWQYHRIAPYPLVRKREGGGDSFEVWQYHRRFKSSFKYDNVVLTTVEGGNLSAVTISDG